MNIHFQETLSPNEANIVATGPIINEAVGLVKGIIFKTDIKDTAIIAFNNKLAFQGYSYLLITKRYGCLCTVVRIHDAHKINLYFERTKEFFLKKIGFQVQPIRDVQGFGSFSLKRFTKGNTLYVGEAAGLQDFLLGFGMKFAIVSGYLAAQSVIYAKDYAKIANQHFGQRLRVGVVNKWLWENILSKKDYSLLLKFPNLIENSYLIHNYTWFQQAMYPLAQFSLKKTYSRLKS